MYHLPHAFFAGRSIPSKDIYTERNPQPKQRVKLSSDTPFTPEYVLNHLNKSTNPSKIYASRVKGRQILLENPVRESQAKKDLEEKRARRAANKANTAAGALATNSARRRKGFTTSATSAETKFDLFVDLHNLWMDYMSELLVLPSPSSGAKPQTHQAQTATTHAKLIKADFHGAMITVRQSKNPSLVGLTGIVILETENAFKIVTPKDRLKLIPKRNSIFAFSVPLYATTTSTVQTTCPEPPPASSNDASHEPSMTSPNPAKPTVLDLPRMEFELYGNQFCLRSADRASRKFKHKETIEL